ncbi:hypothetical protein [Moorena sp. SIO4G3]|uniref:hypothetical protein n=1 Tax=Moorena sp. SIO4G3 TaxID=2607821 RepID=UPI00142CFD92|nr:hypothetical protein [Moorena sp. SIO4G3]NEO79491.1 hypothetical protein [Moorena sp. SIO4G3]
MAPIPVKNNTLYGPPLKNQKYAPLEVNSQDMKIIDSSILDYKKLFDQRIKSLEGKNLLPQQLVLYAADWESIKNKEKAKEALPPIVVISSKRHKWIKARADSLDNTEGSDDINDVNDTIVLYAGAIPWYLPKRIGNQNRRVYMLVNRIEYYNYINTLQGTGITIVGWQFKSQKKENKDGENFDNSYVGFGASRFAAIEFCKKIDINKGKAWLVDDNVVYVQNFPGFVKLENFMDNDKQIWGLGFQGATSNTTDGDLIRELCTKYNPNQDDVMRSGDTEETGLLQQCVLWNIKSLKTAKINFSPYFITSNEDTSFSNLLMTQKMKGETSSKIRIVKKATVFKGEPETNDEEKAAKKITEVLDKVISNQAAQENYKVKQNENEQTLKEYISNTVLDTENKKEQMKGKEHWAQSQAVEQIMAKVVRQKPNWVPEGIFNPKVKTQDEADTQIASSIV